MLWYADWKDPRFVDYSWREGAKRVDKYRPLVHAPDS